jgi:hypothetical protein
MHRLLAAPWVDTAMRAVLRHALAVARDALPECSSSTARLDFDAVVGRAAKPGASTTTEDGTVERSERSAFARVHARTADETVLFRFSDRLSATDRTQAALTLALDPSLRATRLVNLRTGEVQRLTLRDREAFWRALQAA